MKFKMILTSAKKNKTIIQRYILESKLGKTIRKGQRKK